MAVETAKVALQACAGYEPERLEPAMSALLDLLGGLEHYVAAGQRVMLKPNYVSADPPARGSVTHPAVLESLARRILDLGATPVIADAPAWGGGAGVLANCGTGELCARLGIEFWCLDRSARLPSARPATAHAFHVDPRVLEVDALINVGKLKSHQQLGFTAATKNLYGCMAGREKAWHHLARSRTDAHFARFVTAFAASLPVTLNVVDGVVAQEGMGPRLGRPRALGVLLAGESAPAVDTVVADLIDVPLSHRLMLDAAAELDWLPERIEVLGDAVESLAVYDFLFPELIGVAFSPWRLLRGWVRNRRILRAERAAG